MIIYDYPLVPSEVFELFSNGVTSTENWLAPTANPLTVYPNPTTNQLQIQLPQNEKPLVQFRITATDGRVVASEQISSTATSQIDVTNLASGVYFITATNDDKTFIGRFVKK